MRNRIDTILLGLLWLLASTLGTSFWLNTRFGFNIFSAQHWQYLAYLQAAHTPVQTMFYVSVIMSVLITVFGLYILVRPRLRRIRLPRRPASNTAMQTTAQQHIQKSVPQPTSNPDSSTIEIVRGESAPKPAPAPQTVPTPARPPRLNIPTINIRPAAVAVKVIFIKNEE